MTERLEQIKENFEAINREEREYVSKLETLVQPIALAARKMMVRRGVQKGFFFKKRKEMTIGKFFMSQKRLNIIGMGDFSLYYDGELVMKFDNWFPTVSVKNATNQYLFFFREGPWMTKLIKEYYKMMLEVLKENFDMKGEK